MPDNSHAIDKIVCTNAGKRFVFEWVIRDFNFSFHRNKCYGIRGANGSGKSTLLKLLSGHSTPSKGTISFFKNETEINISGVYESITFCAPYIELIEEMTVSELLKFHHGLRPFSNHANMLEVLKDLPFKGLADKRIGELSSGMKQRIKLMLAILTDTSVILLDEPGSNLDQSGKKWFEDLLRIHMQDKIVIIASNEEDDLRLVESIISMEDYKKA